MGKNRRKPIERKRLGPVGGRYSTPFLNYGAGVTKVTPQTIDIKIPRRLLLALQVRESNKQEWGNLRAHSINQYTPDSQKNKLRKELEYLREGWMVNGYFGSNASYRIHEVYTRPEAVTY